jgi:hypothetical protein
MAIHEKRVRVHLSRGTAPRFVREAAEVLNVHDMLFGGPAKDSSDIWEKLREDWQRVGEDLEHAMSETDAEAVRR